MNDLLKDIALAQPFGNLEIILRLLFLTCLVCLRIGTWSALLTAAFQRSKPCLEQNWHPRNSCQTLNNALNSTSLGSWGHLHSMSCAGHFMSNEWMNESWSRFIASFTDYKMQMRFWKKATPALSRETGGEWSQGLPQDLTDWIQSIYTGGEVGGEIYHRPPT